MGDNKKIRSETRFLLRSFLEIMLTPITLVLVLAGRKKWSDLLNPFYETYEFMFEAKFTIIIIVINVVFSVVAAFFFSNELFRALVNYPSNILDYRMYYTLITAGFMHASPIHLFANMLALFVFARAVERKLGPKKTALIYFGALIISSVFYSIINLFVMGSNVPAIGASGAVMGIIAAAVLLDPFGITYSSIVPLPNMISGWLAIYADISGILSQANDGIAHFAHVGGFLSVTVIMFFLSREDRENMEKGLMVNIISICVGVFIFFLVTSGYLPSFDTGGNFQKSLLGTFPL